MLDGQTYYLEPSTAAAGSVPAAPPVNAGDLLQDRLKMARRAFVTRRVPLEDAAGLIRKAQPRSGDVLLARVEKLGQHQHLESPQGRRQHMYEGDDIIVAYGNRYAPDQFDAVVPESLEACDLVAGGGIAAMVRARHGRMKSATRIVPVGLLADQWGRPLNVESYRLGACKVTAGTPVVVVVGTSMNAGKTTTAAGLIRGLSRAGLKVGAAKVTGTGSGGDLWSMRDAGAAVSLDFTDVGFATTAACDIVALEAACADLIGHAARGNDLVVVEIADGLFQTETRALLMSPVLRRMIQSVVLAAGDAMGAAFGARWLLEAGLPLKLLSGCVSASPLGIGEAAQATGLHVATLDELRDPLRAPRLCLDTQLCAT